MPIVINCSACNTRLTIGDDRAGDRFECPQCDAMIKVPGPAQPPTRAQGAAPLSLPEPEIGEEPRGPDKRVVVGIVAGVAALVLVAVAGVALAVRSPAEATRPDPESSGAVTAAPTAKPNESSPGGPPGTGSPSGPAVQPAPPPPGAPAQQFQASFLGSQGLGRRFCIIADNSNSMAGAKLANLKTQLLKTLADLNPESEFYVICFNAHPEPMPHPTWLRAGAPEVEKVRSWVGSLKTVLGTKPVPAFDLAFKLNPPPDVIFFMTDGQFADTAPGQVAALNGTPPKTAINTILFTFGAPKTGAKANAAEGNLKKIADQNRGTFTRYAP